MRSVVTVAAVLVLLVALFHVTGPMLEDFSTYGFHDWDVETAYRHITTVSLRAGEGPWWHPWLCGGVPAWGYVEGATNFVSPYLPIYLLADVRTAIRVELVGQALLALSGAWFFAKCFTRSVALCAFVAALFVFNGRWALQAAVGHTWHLQYALMPWAFFCFERALSGRSLRWAVGSGVALALACFWGGIYPLPHTALLLALYALLRAGLERALRPLLALLVAAGSALGLAAPKLFAVLDHMRKVPRLIESNEVIGLSELLTMLVAPDQRYGERPIPVPAYNWHEWGIYVGPLGLLVLLAALLVARGPRAQAYRALGVLCLLLGFGAFHPLAPWALLHELPIFASQHVPSRFHYPMLLMLGAAFVATLGPALERHTERRPWLELVLLLPVAVFAWDMARFSRTPFEQAFWMRAPAEIPRAQTFEHRRTAPVHYVQRDWAPPMLLAMFANRGVIKCYGVDPTFRPSAVPVGARGYQGLAHVAGPGRARIVEWSPNRALVEVEAAGPDALVVYNMNYDASWRANGAAALEHDGRVAARLASGSGRVEFRYFPRTLPWGGAVLLLTLGACCAPARWYRRLRPAARS